MVTLEDGSMFGGRHLVFAVHHVDFRGRNDTFGERRACTFISEDSNGEFGGWQHIFRGGHYVLRGGK